MSAVDAARAVVPAWVLWLPLLCVAIVVALTGALTWAVTRLPLARALAAAAEPWTERARRVHAVRAATQSIAVLAPVGWTMLMGVFLRGAFAYGPPGVRLSLCCMLSYLAAAAVALANERRLQPTVSARELWIGFACQLVAVSPGLLLLFGFAPLMPDHLDGRTAPAFVALALVLGFFIVGGGMGIARCLGLARPASPRLLAAVERAAGQGPRPRFVLELRLSHANALALPVLGGLVVTRRALESLDDDELAAICAHELGHLSEPAPMKLVRVLPVFAVVYALCCMNLLIVELGLPGLVGLMLLLLAIVLLVRRASRWMEARADRLALGDETNPTYARALERLYETNLIPAVLSRSGTHPSLYDRMIAAGVRPAYERPRSPPSGRLGPAMVGAVLSLGALTVSYGRATSLRERGEVPALKAVALTGGEAAALARLARARRELGDARSAGLLARAALELEPTPALPFWRRAELLADADRCDDAEEELDRHVDLLDAMHDSRYASPLDALEQCVTRERTGAVAPR